MTESPLGDTTRIPERYAPDVLFAIPRAENRARLGLGKALPFDGVDIWNAWELSWLAANGQPRVATAEISIPAGSPAIVESKSLKLYLGSFAMMQYASRADVRELIATDVGKIVGTSVDVRLDAIADTEGASSGQMPGESLDHKDVSCDAWEVDAGLLAADTGSVVSEELHSNLLRSLCPVTSQPDSGGVLVRYHGPQIDREGLLRYIVSYRQHQDFHENCVERMFVDIQERCRPGKLTVYARYQRRGGIDINPFRSNFESSPPNLRLWRQ